MKITLGTAEGLGFGQLMSQLAFERLLLAVPAAATIDRARELTVEHSRNRKMFGGTLLDQQNTRFRLAEAATTSHIVRGFINSCIQQLLDGTLDPQAAYMAKWWCTDQQCKVVDECLTCQQDAQTVVALRRISPIRFDMDVCPSSEHSAHFAG